jgi:hypothetical protein
MFAKFRLSFQTPFSPVLPVCLERDFNFPFLLVHHH